MPTAGLAYSLLCSGVACSSGAGLEEVEVRPKGKGRRNWALGMVSLPMTRQAGLVRVALLSGRVRMLGENGALKALEGSMRLENRCSGGKVVRNWKPWKLWQGTGRG